MNKKNQMMFFDADDGGDNVSAGMAALSDDSAAPDNATPAPSPAPTVDAKALAEQFGAVIGKVIPRPAPVEPSQPKLTPEEAKKLLNVWEPTPEWTTQFDNLETRNQALMQLRDGFLRQFDTISQVRLNDMQERMLGQMAPVMQFMESYQAEQREKAFNDAYPTLSKPELKPLILAVALQLKSQGKTFNGDQNALFEALAKGAEAVIKVQNPNFSLTEAKPQQTTNGRSSNANAIPVTSPGGGGGGGNQKGQAAGKSRGLAIFD